MSKGKSLFEQLGGTYTEGTDGLLYPNFSIYETDVKQADVFTGKYGDIWKKYLKENHSDRYLHLVRLGKLQVQALAVNEEANEMQDTITNQYLKSHKPANPSSTMEMWKIREQAKAVAEEVVLHDIVYCFH
nr:TnpV protein [uncultured Anaerosporobacter sp.]